MDNKKFTDVEELDDGDFAVLQAVNKLISIINKKNNSDVVDAIKGNQFPVQELVSAIQAIEVRTPDIKLPEIRVPEIKYPDVQVNTDKLVQVMSELLSRNINVEMEVIKRDYHGRIEKVKIKSI